MTTNFIVIPSKDNIPTHVYSEKNLHKYTYAEVLLIDNRLDYFDCYTVCDNLIHSGDMCLVTDPDGYSFPEVCAQTIFQKDCNIYYGTEGTRCLLCDAEKIIATTNKALQSESVSTISGEVLLLLLEERRLKYSKPSFYNF